MLPVLDLNRFYIVNLFEHCALINKFLTDVRRLRYYCFKGVNMYKDYCNLQTPIKI